MDNTEIVPTEETQVKLNLSVDAPVNDFEIQQEPEFQQEESEPQIPERVCSIELKNNNLIYIHYSEDWTLKDGIQEIIKNKDFQTGYNQRQWIINTSYLTTMFDLNLILLRLLKKDYETRINYDIKLLILEMIGLLKDSSEFPFFTLKDNLTPLPFLNSETNQEKISMYKSVIETNNLYGMYNFYLPHTNIITMLNSHPYGEEYFQKRKLSLNKFNKMTTSPLISDKDWFIYDDESMKYLLEMNKKKINIKSLIKIINGKLYFEDRLEAQKISDSDLGKFFISVTLVLGHGHKINETLTKKIIMTSKTTALNVIESINKKVELMKEELKFDPTKKILKAKSLNDYIFDLSIPLVNYAYINECVKSNTNAEYCIIDNPLLKNETQTQGEDNSNEKNIIEESSLLGNQSNSMLELENELMNIAVHIEVDENKEKDLREMLIKNSNFNGLKKNSENNNINDKDKINSFMNEIGDSIIKKYKDDYEEGINSNQDDEHDLNQLAKEITNEDDEEISMIKGTNTNGFGQSSKYKFKQFDSNTSSFFDLTSQSLISTSKRRTKYVRTPNIYKENRKVNADIKSMCDSINQDYIDIKDVNREFNITIHNAGLNKVYNSSYEKTIQNTVLIFRLQLYNGNQPFSKPKQIKWITKNEDTAPSFNKKIYFDLKYNNLLLFTSLLVKVSFLEYNKKNELVSNNVIAWSNLRGFDPNNRLKTGKHKLFLYSRAFNDDSYFLYIKSHEPNPVGLYLELESFCKPLLYKEIIPSNTSFQFQSFILDPGDMQKVNEIMEKSPFEELNNYEKDVLYKNRYFVAKIPSGVPKLLLCFNYNDETQINELNKVFEGIKELTPIQAIELLGGKYLNNSIRKFAVKCLKKMQWIEIQNYLGQLVQGGKYELTHSSDGADFLLKMAINHPVTIGHSFFWSLRSEMFNKSIQQRFGLYLEIFLNKIGKNLNEIFVDEDHLMKKLSEISKIPFNKTKTKEEKLALFKDSINELNKSMIRNKKETSIPLNFKFRTTGINVNKCKFMKSKKKPLWLTFKNADSLGDDLVVMFKQGDDLRMDIVTLQLFKAMQVLWFNQKLKLKMSGYRVICTGENQGMLEMVTNSITLADIQVKEGGAIQNFFSKTPLKKWGEMNCVCDATEYTNNFYLSSVAYSIATFVLGIGDRHNDNIMLKMNGEIFHIDFGHFLGHFKYKMGIKRERAPFVFTQQMQLVGGGEKSEMFLQFKELLWKAYNVLRNHCDVLITGLRIGLVTDIPELDEGSLKFGDGSLALRMNDTDAKVFLEEKLNESINSVMTKVNFAIHIVANS